MVKFEDHVLVFISILHSSTVVWTAGKGQHKVIGSLKPIFAAPGDDVILPCHLEPSVNVVGLTVEWSRPDVKPDPSDRLSQVGYVHVYRNRHDDPDVKLKSYERRTKLFADGLKSGNISLWISNITLEDQGRYRCFLPKLDGNVKASVVTLVVDPIFKAPTTETPPHLDFDDFVDPKNETDVKVMSGVRSHLRIVIPAVVLGVLLILCGVFFLKYKRQKLPEYIAPNTKILV